MIVILFLNFKFFCVCLQYILWYYNNKIQMILRKYTHGNVDRDHVLIEFMDYFGNFIDKKDGIRVRRGGGGAR